MTSNFKRRTVLTTSLAAVKTTTRCGERARTRTSKTSSSIARARPARASALRAGAKRFFASLKFFTGSKTVFMRVFLHTSRSGSQIHDELRQPSRGLIIRNQDVGDFHTDG